MRQIYPEVARERGSYGMTRRPGGFPRINRPPSPVKTAAVETKPATVLSTAAPVRHGLLRPAAPPSLAARPALASKPVPASRLPPPLEVEPEYDEDGRRLITSPLTPLPRPAPTILHPTPASRAASQPARQPGSGLLASQRPAFQPPSQPAPPPIARTRPPKPAVRRQPTPQPLTPDDIEWE